MCHVKAKVTEYYESVPWVFQPANMDMPLHLYWAKATTTFKPQKARRQLFRTVKEVSVKERPKVDEVKIQMEDVVNVIEK